MNRRKHGVIEDLNEWDAVFLVARGPSKEAVLLKFLEWLTPEEGESLPHFTARVSGTVETMMKEWHESRQRASGHPGREPDRLE